jgi:hypothetical protein
MLKVAVAVLAVALAGTASAIGWRSMRIDASSEADFTASVNALKEKLPKVRCNVLDLALHHIWVQGAEAAAAEQREHSSSEFLRQLDGLSYKEVVTLTDPSGETAAMWYRQVRGQLYMARLAKRPPVPMNAWRNEGYIAPGSLDGANMRGGVAAIERNNAWHAR